MHNYLTQKGGQYKNVLKPQAKSSTGTQFASDLS